MLSQGGLSAHKQRSNAAPQSRVASQSVPRSSQQSVTQRSVTAPVDPRNASATGTPANSNDYTVAGMQEEGEDAEERPSKRARFDNVADVYSQAHAQLREKNAPATLPFPSLPSRSRQAKASRPTAAELASRRADGISPPAIATKLADGTAADFRPWTGDHAEDVISEQAIKGGYSDKGPSPNQNESSSARATVWPSLTVKNNIPLTTLSLLYSQVLERRQVAGRILAPSTFKPPPRVTVTDTKREAWLRDLANPTISLKRQSRTIPHGIRGKVLLEQCLLKEIPLQRAIWLAKCVGANELRAFRRKGVSGTAAAQGEAKWSRDWTVQVIQFFSDMLRAKPTDGWRTHVEYSTKLVTALFSEGLLEQAYFLDWLVSTLENIPLDQLPLWLLPINIFWPHLIALDQRARRLGIIILTHLTKLNDSGHAIYMPLIARLRRMICALATHNSESLVIPAQWSQFKPLIHSCLPVEPQSTLWASIASRNERLMAPSSATSTTIDNPLRRLHIMLDTASLDVDITQLTQKVISLVPDLSMLVSHLIRWAGTRLRAGNARPLLVTSILELLGRDASEITTAILSSLTDLSVSQHSLQDDNIILAVRQLSAAGLFSAGQYMQWLIATGALARKQESALLLKILLALPSKNLSQHLVNTRAALLARAGHDSASSVEQLYDILTSDLQGQVFQASDETLRLLQEATSPEDVCTWVLYQATLRTKEGSMTPAGYSYLRTVLETMSDISSLHDLLQLMAISDEFRVIGMAADTVNMHAIEFAIIGSLKTITTSLVDRYRILRKQQPLERSSVYALRNLVKEQDDSLATIRLFNSDIAVYEQQNLNSVCSPASDNLIGIQANTLDSDEEIEAVFASGNTMDEQVMRRVLDRVMQRATQAVAKTTDEQTAICRWLVQLRMLDRTTFDRIAAELVFSLLHTEDASTIVSSCSALIAADCLGVDTLVNLLGEQTQAQAADAALNLLFQSLPTYTALSSLERYHFDLQQASFCRRSPDSVSKLLRKALEHNASNTIYWQTAAIEIGD